MRTDTEVTYGNYYGNCQNTQGLRNILTYENCFCNCESENREEDRYFSLLEALSDVEKNK